MTTFLSSGRLAVPLLLLSLGACGDSAQDATPAGGAAAASAPQPVIEQPEAKPAVIQPSIKPPQSGETSQAAAHSASVTPDESQRSSKNAGMPRDAKAAGASALPEVLVHKSASCGCCSLWVDHLRAAGFTVDVRNADNLEPVKSRLGVPFGKGSCHTAEVAGYFVEGHVPASDIKRLIAEKPDAKGLALPGMPLGSPGMEVPDGTVEAFTVELVSQDGTTSPFTQHGQ